ncbi:hypothetical protein GCM10007916_24870 [Psychromonas marina]|uniref:N-acetyltransferase domain-containing protein n=1 Tax=Psychromonas marina TaxID=88364 RepID=A0ABQ6E2H9_9GAMM|nr:GNAT family N-acetyltransferase [Psychromonas marina]GLS91418.1 hypothetical protein GCM10007916_24870 [Psychromonas marina]
MASLTFLKAKANALNELSDFYLQCGYGGDVSPADEVFYVMDENKLVAVLRLALEEGVCILRGMQVLPCLRGNNLGRQLLSYMIENLPAQHPAVFCLPHQHLTRFYQHAGFMIATPKTVPNFLIARRAKYIKKGLNIEMMVCVNKLIK